MKYSSSSPLFCIFNSYENALGTEIVLMHLKSCFWIYHLFERDNGKFVHITKLPLLFYLLFTGFEIIQREILSLKLMLDPTKSLHTLHNMDRNFSIEKQRNHGRRSNPLGTKDIESGATRGGYQWLVVSWLLTPPHSQYSLCLRIIMWLLVFTIMKSLFELSDNLSSLWPPFPT